MKKAIIISITAIVLMFAPMFIQAQNPPHPNGGNSPDATNTPVGGGAPLDGGITLLFAMGAGYAIRKTLKQSKLLNL
jgi:hypothetical protein